MSLQWILSHEDRSPPSISAASLNVQGCKTARWAIISLSNRYSYDKNKSRLRALYLQATLTSHRYEFLNLPLVSRRFQTLHLSRSILFNKGCPINSDTPLQFPSSIHKPHILSASIEVLNRIEYLFSTPSNTNNQIRSAN
jgi:hypothetical protein